MKKATHILIITIIMTVFTINLKAQDYSEQAKKYFEKYLTTELLYGVMIKSLPTLEDCKFVFKGREAYTYFGIAEEMRTSLSSKSEKENIKFVKVRIKNFSTQDVMQGNASCTGGLKNIKEKLQPYVIFYGVKFLKEEGATTGVSSRYWVFLNGRWVFFLF